MKPYILAQGYTFVEKYDDLKDRQFFLGDVVYENSETNSTMGNIVMDRQETYTLFIKKFNPEDFKEKLEKIINAANTAGVKATLGNSIDAERQEQGHMITMSFIIQGG